MIFKYFDEINKHKDILGISYIGTVVDNADPDQQGRIKVTVVNLFEGDTDLLPWVYAKVRGGSDFKNINVPEVDSLIEIYFPTKDLYFPVYDGNISTAVGPGLDADYPDTYGFVDSVGNKFIVNKKTENVYFEHSSGAKINIDKDGNLDITAPKKISVNSDDAVEVKGATKGTFEGTSETIVGNASGTTQVLGTTVALAAAGGLPVAVVGSQAVGIGNLGAPVSCSIVDGSSKVTAPL